MPPTLILAQSGDTTIVAAMAHTAVALDSSPIIVAAPADVVIPAGTRGVQVKRDVAAITALRIGMAQLTNTTATAVLVWPSTSASVSIESLRSLIDAAASEPGVIAVLAGVASDLAPMAVPRDAWLELVTLGEGGLDAIAARRRVVSVIAPPGATRLEEATKSVTAVDFGLVGVDEDDKETLFGLLGQIRSASGDFR